MKINNYFIQEIDGKTEYENMNVWIVTAKDDQGES